MSETSTKVSIIDARCPGDKKIGPHTVRIKIRQGEVVAQNPTCPYEIHSKIKLTNLVVINGAELEGLPYAPTHS